MNYETARNFLLNQGTALLTERNPDDFLKRLKNGKAPIPGQVTSLLLALKLMFEATRDEPTLDRQLVCALHTLAYESRQLFEYGRLTGIEWPPLLNEDLTRIASAVQSIFAGVSQK
jgi:hypothetical protein